MNINFDRLVRTLKLEGFDIDLIVDPYGTTLAEVLEEAYDDLEELFKKDAYEDGYDEGLYLGEAMGYDDGFDKGYDAGYDKGVVAGITGDYDHD